MIESDALIDAVVSHAAASGYFDRVNRHEPKSAPGSGLSAAVWADSIGPARSSGLAETTALVVMNVRVFTSMLTDPPDAIDPAVMKAVDDLMGAYSGDFTLDGLVRCVDLLGMGGTPLSARAGYVNIDGKLMRIFTITVPVLIDEAWTQTP